MEKTTAEPEENRYHVLGVQERYPNLSVRVVIGHAPQETEKFEARAKLFESNKVEVETEITY